MFPLLVNSDIKVVLVVLALRQFRRGSLRIDGFEGTTEVAFFLSDDQELHGRREHHGWYVVEGFGARSTILRPRRGVRDSQASIGNHKTAGRQRLGSGWLLIVQVEFTNWLLEPKDVRYGQNLTKRNGSESRHVEHDSGFKVLRPNDLRHL